ncbi:MAG TPA: dTDP-glucose 4,6-dehydratase [Candidatus Nanoarchaeia archaeon]|nr:dTDP-glucose 4,6-dehydratase [Candidatus Nanoarchaeia archaeon]
MRNMLITGGAGFIGSNFIPYYLEKEEGISIINLDNLTYAGNINNLKELVNYERYKFIKGDICDKELVYSIFSDYDIKGVIHLAAESHVDNSIKDSDIFMRTNVLGTHNLVKVAYNQWMDSPFTIKKECADCRFLHVSTDEVYGSLGKDGLFSEKTPYDPRSPYSASKAGSDMIVKAFHHTYGLNVVLTNCGNNYGPKQHDEKLIPTIIRNALLQRKIPIYGDGKNIRDWVYVEDHCRGLELVFNMGKSGENYNIGGKNERDNNYIAKKVCEILDELVPKNNGSYKDQITYVKDRPGHDKRYAIDASKIKSELGWKAKMNFEGGIKETVKWYLNNKTWVAEGRDCYSD